MTITSSIEEIIALNYGKRLTVKDVSLLLVVDRHTIYKLIKSGQLRAFKLNSKTSRYIIFGSDLIKFLKVSTSRYEQKNKPEYKNKSSKIKKQKQGRIIKNV